MAVLEFSEAARNAMLETINTLVTDSNANQVCTIKLFTGGVPATCASANPAGEIWKYVTGTDIFEPASGGVMTKDSGITWSAAATGNGTAASWRLYTDGTGADGTTCIAQGDVSTVAAGTGSLQLDNTAMVTDQVVTISTFTFTAPNTDQ